MLLTINPDNPETRKINQVVDCLKKGGVIIYPTDTLYGLGCDISNQKAVERICQLKGIQPKKANLSFICNDLSHLSEYAAQFDSQTFKLIKRLLPGPFTFILKATNKVPKILKQNKKTVGIRIPNHPIAQSIVEHLGRPILSSSLKMEDDLIEYWTDPTEIHDVYGKQVDLIIDGGIGKLTPSTVLDCTQDGIEIIREGAGIEQLEF